MRVPIRLRLIFSLAVTAVLVVLLVLVMFFPQASIQEAQGVVQQQQARYDALRRAQVLVLRISDESTDSAAVNSVGAWRNELLAVLPPASAGGNYSAVFDNFEDTLGRVMDTAASGRASAAVTLRDSQLAPLARNLVNQQDAMLADSLRGLDAARDDLAEATGSANNFRLIGGGVALLLLLLSGWTTLNWVGYPVAQLAGQMRQAVASGDRWPDFRVGATAPREVADLAAGFNALANQLRQNTLDMEQANMKLADLNTEVLAASRAKSAFLATMSHELRTPLNSIIGFSEMLLAEVYGPLTDKQRTQMERLLRNSQNLLTLINDVLDISRVEAGKLPLQIDTVDSERLLHNIVSTVEPLARQKGLTVLVDNGPLPLIRTDEARLRQVLLNLVSNAIKFTKQGAVTIGTRSDPSLPNWIVFTVADTGIGIAPEEIDKIWDEFYQVKTGLSRDAGGSGLGLAIVRQLIDALGGDVDVQSAPGEGTRFTVYMPLEPSTVADGASGASLYAATGSYSRNGGTSLSELRGARRADR